MLECSSTISWEDSSSTRSSPLPDLLLLSTLVSHSLKWLSQFCANICRQILSILHYQFLFLHLLHSILSSTANIKLLKFPIFHHNYQGYMIIDNELMSICYTRKRRIIKSATMHLIIMVVWNTMTVPLNAER